MRRRLLGKIRKKSVKKSSFRLRANSRGVSGTETRVSAPASRSKVLTQRSLRNMRRPRRGYRRMKRGRAGEMGGPGALSVSPRVESRWRKLLDAFPAESFRNESLQISRADRRVRVRGRRVWMDITRVSDRTAVGGGRCN